MKEKVVGFILFISEVATYLLMLQLLPFAHYKRIGVLWFLLMFINGHYQLKQTLIWDDVKNCFKTAVTFYVASAALLYPYPRLFINITILTIVMFAGGLLFSRTYRIIFRKSIAKKTLIIGTNSTAYRLGQIADNNRYALTNVVGYVHYEGKHIYKDFEGSNRTIFEYEDIIRLIKQHHITQVFITIADSDLSDKIVLDINQYIQYIKVVPQIDNTVTFATTVEDFDGILVISSSKGHISSFELLIKRCIDLCAALVGCLILLPLTLYVKSLNHKQGDNDPIFFTQDRIGKDGKLVKIYKFRTMVPHAEELLEELMEKDPAIKQEYLTNKKLANDPRITKAGEILRKTSLDEFPQFINVLKGEMALVGPRPYLPREQEDMGGYYNTVIKVKPGITGMWQANGRSDIRFKDRLIMDDYYYRNWTLSLDLIIIYKTFKSVLYGKGAL